MSSQIHAGKRVMVVSPHPDDETLGVGGTIAKYSAQGAEVFVLIFQAIFHRSIVVRIMIRRSLKQRLYLSY